MRVEVGGKRWTMVFTEAPSHEDDEWIGYCDWPGTANKRIYIDRSVSSDSKKLMDTVLHEILHAGVWTLDEEYVGDYATAATEALHRLGYRLIRQPELPFEPFKEAGSQ